MKKPFVFFLPPVLFMLIVSAGLALPAMAQEQGLSKAAKGFVEKAAQGGLMEVQLGSMAEQKAQSQEVKEFGARMVADHGKANEELKALARDKGLSLPEELDKKHQKTVDKFKEVSDSDFDKKYMKEMVTDHIKDVSKFQKASRTLEDPEIKAWVDKTLPVLEDHLTLARSVAKKQGVDVEETEEKARKEAEKEAEKEK